MKNSKTLRILGALTLGAGLALAQPQAALAASCSGYSCDGKDAAATGCGNTITAASANIHVSPSSVTGKIELRYSRTCRTVWARIQIWKEDYEKGAISLPRAQVMRTSDDKYFGCKNLVWSATTTTYTCYTPMLNDAGLSSFANAQLNYYNAPLYAETSEY